MLPLSNCFFHHIFFIMLLQGWTSIYFKFKLSIYFKVSLGWQNFEDYPENHYRHINNKDYPSEEDLKDYSNDKSISDEPTPKNIQKTLEHLARSGNMRNSADWLRKPENRQFPEKTKRKEINNNIFPENELEEEENIKDYGKNSENVEDEDNGKDEKEDNNWTNKKEEGKEEEYDDNNEEEGIGLFVPAQNIKHLKYLDG
ncbi:unnamed protein product [Meloidogyne enterolobii]|uniref:Uncharacterized protein n=1 Tax=Meloidogyne enterolobii TaxID=390850 RepID=A0ACB0YRU6_MELEN